MILCQILKTNVRIEKNVSSDILIYLSDIQAPDILNYCQILTRIVRSQKVRNLLNMSEHKKSDKK